MWSVLNRLKIDRDIGEDGPDSNLLKNNKIVQHFKVEQRHFGNLK